MYKLSNNSKDNLRGVKSPLFALVERSLKKSPHDFGIPRDGGKRSAERQHELYEIGRTKEKDRKPITWLDGYDRKSYHQSGMAFDIFVYDEHGACWDCKWKYKEIADVIKSEFVKMQKEGHFCKCERLVWGGDWETFKDLPHFEVRKR